jgi:hypothetical protein
MFPVKNMKKAIKQIVHFPHLQVRGKILNIILLVTGIPRNLLALVQPSIFEFVSYIIVNTTRSLKVPWKCYCTLIKVPSLSSAWETRDATSQPVVALWSHISPGENSTKGNILVGACTDK